MTIHTATITLPNDARVYTWRDGGGDYMLTIWGITPHECVVSIYADTAYGPEQYERVDATPAAYSYIRSEWSNGGHGGCHATDAIAGCGTLNYAERDADDELRPVPDTAYLIAFDGMVFATRGD